MQQGVALLGFGVLMLSRFAPKGAKRLDTHSDMEAEEEEEPAIQT